MSAPQGSPAEPPVLRAPATGNAPRRVGRPPQASEQPLATTPAAETVDATASARPALHAAAPVADEELLRRTREEAWQAGVSAGREQAAREHTHAGFEEGLRQGLTEGRSAGELEAQRRLAAAQEHAAERLSRLDRLQAAWTEQLHAAFRARLDAAEGDMVALCHGVICRLLGDSLVTHAGAVQCVQAAIAGWLLASEKQSRGEGVRVHVHPADLDVMRNDEVLARWLVQQGLRGIAWEPDDGVALGGCLIESEEGDLDARLETQLEALRAQLVRARREARDVPASAATGEGPPR